MVHGWLSKPEGYRKALAWNCVFTTVNLAQVARLVYQRRPVEMTDAESQAHRLLFGPIGMRKPMFRRLARDAGMSRARLPPGAELTTEGEPCEEIMLVLSGSCDVLRGAGSDAIATVGPGGLIGEVRDHRGRGFEGEASLNPNAPVTSG